MSIEVTGSQQNAVFDLQARQILETLLQQMTLALDNAVPYV